MLPAILLALLYYAPYCSAADILRAENTHVYSYSTNISIEGRPTAYKVINEVAHVTPYYLDSSKRKAIVTGKKLLHIQLLHNGQEDKENVYEAFSIHDDQGMIKVVHIPDRGTDMVNFNVLKGLLSLFVIHPNFESGFEIDSSGKCHVSYAAVEDHSTSQEIRMMDKEKIDCVEVQKPIDKWNYDIFPQSYLGKPKRSMIRYHLRNRDGRLLKVESYEAKSIPLVHGSSSSESTVISWQYLEFTKDVQRRVPKHLPDPHLSKMVKVISELSKSSTLKLHLAPSPPLESQSQSCTINHHLTDTESTDEGTVSDNDLTLKLTSAVEAARNSLHSYQLGAIQPTHVVLQLTNLMRCLPNRPTVVTVLAQATMLAPPAVQADLLYRQATTWREQLSNVLVACGTPTCTSVLTARLAALTDMAFPNSTVRTTESQEVEIYHQMLFERLWPSLSNLRQIDTVHAEQLLASCKQVPLQQLRSICDLSLVNIWSHTSRLDKNVTRYLVELVKTYLRSGDDEENLDNLLDEGSNKSVGETIELTDALTLVGVGMVNRVSIREFLDSMVRMVEKPPLISSSVYASVIHTATMLNKDYEKEGSDKLERYRSILIATLTENEDKYIIAQACLHGLLRLDSTPLRISELLDKLASNGRFALVRSVHMLAKELCDYDELPSLTCRCFENVPMEGLDQRYCKLNMAAGWSGLAIVNASKLFGNEQQIEGELCRTKDGSVIEYETRFVTGTSGELLYSRITMSAQLREWKMQLFELQTFADNLESLNPIAKKDSKNPPKRDGGWVSLSLNVFDTTHPPWKVFSGSYAKVIKLLFSAPSKPVSALRFLQVPIDRREYQSFASGWVLRIDTLGVASVDLSSALETSFYTRSGRSLVRIRYSLAIEQYLYAYGNSPKSASTALFTNGGAIEGTVDFVSMLALSKLSSGICVAMNRGAPTLINAWQEDNMNATYKLIRESCCKPFEYRKIAGHSNSSQFQLLGASYNLGKINSDICGNMNMKSIW